MNRINNDAGLEGIVIQEKSRINTEIVESTSIIEKRLREQFTQLILQIYGNEVQERDDRYTAKKTRKISEDGISNWSDGIRLADVSYEKKWKIFKLKKVNHHTIIVENTDNAWQHIIKEGSFRPLKIHAFTPEALNLAIQFAEAYKMLSSKEATVIKAFEGPVKIESAKPKKRHNPEIFPTEKSEQVKTIIIPTLQAKVTYDEKPSYVISRFLKEKGYLITNEWGEITDTPNDQVIGIVKEEITGGMFRKTKKLHYLGDLFLNCPQRFAQENNQWIVDAYGNENACELKQLMEEITKNYGIKVNIFLKNDEAKPPYLNPVANEDLEFKFKDLPIVQGMKTSAKSLRELADILFARTPNIENYVTKEQNHFANWISDAIGDVVLAEKIKPLDNRLLISKEVYRRVNSLKKYEN